MRKYLYSLILLASTAKAADPDIDALKKIVSVQQAQIATLVKAVKTDPIAIGRSSIQVDYSGQVNSTWNLLQNGWGQTHSPDLQAFKLYDRTMKARICLMWTDNCTAGIASIRMISGAGQAVNSAESANTIYQSGDAFSLTWSGNSLWHTTCGQWQPAAGLMNCGAGWGSSCQLQIKRSEQICSMVVKEAHIEWMASYP